MGSIIGDGHITGTQLAERLLVNPETGVILACRDVQKGGQKSVPIGYIKPGSVGGGGGYVMVNFAHGYRKYKKLRAHHIVWTWVHGEWPKGEIDHINGDRSDNRIENLREVTVAQNRTNRLNSTTRTSGYKWCTQNKKTGKWTVQIQMPGTPRKWYFRQDNFSTPKEA